MQYRRLGRSGLKVSEVGLGTWLNLVANPAAATALVDTAIELGINFFDTANTDGFGGAEELLGRALARHRRDTLVVATKVWGPMGDGPNQRGLSRKHLRDQCDASLRRLGLDYLDLYQCQRYDPETPLDETIATLDDLIASGRILYWGISGWSQHELTNAMSLTERERLAQPVSYQLRYNLLERAGADELLPVLRRHGLAPLAYSPLAQGVLTGKYRDGAIPAGSRLADSRLGINLRRRYGAALDGELVGELAELARQLAWTPAQLALSYLLGPGGATAVIVGAREPWQLAEAAAASGQALPDDIVQALPPGS